jgi:hypothetical protein
MFAIKFQHALAATNLLLFGALVLTNARAATEFPPADVLRAKLIELVNEAGEMRAQLFIGENGGGQMRLRNGAGEIRVKLGATDDGAILLMLDRETEPGVRLATESSGPNLKLIDPAKGETIVAP